MKKSTIFIGFLLSLVTCTLLPTSCGEEDISPDDLNGNNENPSLPEEETLSDFPKSMENFDDYVSEPSDIIKFKDPFVRAICIKNWDKNGDGELSYGEAALVSEKDFKGFKGNKDITSFNELRYFKILKAIPSSSFNGCTSLTSIALPSTLETIEPWAFNGCSELVQIHLSTNIKKIDYEAFSGCSSLTQVNLKDLDKWFSVYIKENASSPFLACAGMYLNGKLIEELIIPDEVKAINDYQFYGCSSIQKITWNKVQKIGEQSFKLCKGLEQINLPQTLQKIGEEAFYGCSNAKEIDIKTTIVSKKCFQSCTALRKATIGTTEDYFRTEIDVDAFRDCLNLTTIVFRPSVTEINGGCFYDCKKLTAINLPTQLQSLGYSVFTGCSIEKIYIPATLVSELAESLSSNVFSGCMALKEINVAKESTKYTSIDGVVYNKDCTKILICPQAKEELTLPTSVSYFPIGQLPVNVKTLNLPSTTALDHLRVPNGNLSAINIIDGNGVTDNLYSSVDGILYDCEKSTLLLCPPAKKEIRNIPNTVSRIGDYSFYGARPNKVILPSSISVIGEGAFFCVSSMATIELPDGLKRIEASAFSQFRVTATNFQPSIKKIVIPNSVTYLGDDAFSNSDDLKDVKLSESLTQIEAGTFAGCHGLVTIEIPNSVTAIKKGAFSECYSLKNVTLGKGLKEIESNVFTSGPRLEKLVCNSSTPPSLVEINRSPHWITMEDNGIIYVPKESVEAYKQQWPQYAKYIQAIP